MTKKYMLFPIRRHNAEGRVLEGFITGLADIGCFGSRYYDLAGYPHDSVNDAISGDWRQVGDDLRGSISSAERQEESRLKETTEREKPE